MLPFSKRKYYESFSFHEMTLFFIKFRGQKDTYRRKSPHRSMASSAALILWQGPPNLFLSCCHPKNTFQQLIPAPEDILRGRRGLSVLSEISDQKWEHHPHLSQLAGARNVLGDSITETFCLCLPSRFSALVYTEPMRCVDRHPRGSLGWGWRPHPC